MTTKHRAPNRMQHRLIAPTIAVVILAICASLFACTDQKPAGPPEKVTIAYAPTNSILAQVAQAQDYYLQEGLEATLHLQPYGKLALKEMLEGKADFAICGETPIMFAIMNGEEISIIATIQISNKDSAIIARRDKGILTPSDLKSRKIGMTSGTVSDFLLDAFLAVNGISRKEVKVVNMKADDLPDALANGELDVIATFSPFVTQAQKKLGNKGTTFYGEDIYTQTFDVVATQEYIRRNPGKVRKLLSALINAEKFAGENRVEAQKIVADLNRMDIAMIREIWAITSYSITLDQQLLLALEDESRWAIKGGLTRARKVPNYLDFIYLDGLASVKPEAVRILR